MVKLDQKLVDRIKNLQMVYTNRCQPELLIQIPNDYPDIWRKVVHITDEFTSVCPLNPSQPDHARIIIEFEPEDYLVELKSLKFYLTSFRQVLIFHEEAPAIILKDLVGILGDINLTVVGEFTVRGGLHTTVTAINIGWEDSEDE